MDLNNEIEKAQLKIELIDTLFEEFNKLERPTGLDMFNIMKGTKAGLKSHINGIGERIQGGTDRGLGVYTGD